MKRIVIALIMLTAGAASAAESIGYIDTARVNEKATEPVRLLSEVQQLANAAQTAKPEASAAAWERARTRNAEVQATLRSRVAAVRDQLRIEKHLAQVVSGPGAAVSPGVDLTDLAIARLNALDAAGMAAELERTKAELAAARAKLPRDTPPSPPAAPAARPVVRK